MTGSWLEIGHCTVRGRGSRRTCAATPYSCWCRGVAFKYLVGGVKDTRGRVCERGREEGPGRRPEAACSRVVQRQRHHPCSLLSSPHSLQPRAPSAAVAVHRSHTPEPSSTLRNHYRKRVRQRGPDPHRRSRRDTVAASSSNAGWRTISTWGLRPSGRLFLASSSKPLRW